MKVREVVYITGWVDGGGTSYSQCYSDQIIYIVPEDLTGDMDWDWWETEGVEVKEGEDTQITVKYYNANAGISNRELLAEWSVWQNDLIKQREEQS